MNNTSWHWGTHFQLDSIVVFTVLLLIVATLWIRLYRHTREWLKSARPGDPQRAAPSKTTLLRGYGRTQLFGESVVAILVTLVVFALMLNLSGEW